VTRRRRWRFDVDGCLVDSFAGTSLRPHAAELLGALKAAGCEVTVWSAGGADHAARVLDRVGIAHLVDGVHDKDRGPDGRWTLDDVDAADLVCVDDQPEGLPDGVEAVAVFPYIGPDPNDRALQRILEGLSAVIPARPSPDTR
jgi:phosphoglycolate phosphatase-like HAD superfamily hydrolase